jgi:hypothetical protein
VLLTDVSDRFDVILLWGAVATALMTTLLEGSRLLGFSRISLPFLMGTMVSGRRSRAIVWGYVLYALGGWVFAFIYAMIFESLGRSGWWFGGLIGLVHGAALLTLIAELPYLHPRMATEFDGPTARHRLEPPGRFGMNYGRQTPIITLIAQVVYGLLLGATY